jgi:hypothetical protein
MANTLQSPGVSVSVIDESFYTPAAPGTVPLVIVASAANKANASNTGLAVGTDPANAGKVYTITSQRDLTDTFGTPLFYTDTQGNPIHGGELNEYGLQAAYSLLGVSSKAYVVRANIDLGQLTATSDAPAGPPTDGSYWLDTSNTLFGLFEWNSATGTFANKSPIVIDSSNRANNTVNADGLTPKPSLGTNGSYAVVLDTSDMNNMYFKNSNGNWVQVGSSNETAFASNVNNATFVSTTWQTSWPAVTSTTSNPAFTASPGAVTINGNSITVTTASTVASIAASINSTLHTKGIGAKANSSGKIELYTDLYPGSLTVAGNASTLATLGVPAGVYTGPQMTVAPHTQYPNYGTAPSGSVYLKTTSPNSGAHWIVKQYSANTESFTQIAAPIYNNSASALYNIDKTGGGTNIPVGTLFIEASYDHGDGFASTSTQRPITLNFEIQRRAAVAPTTITSKALAVAPVLVNGTTMQIAETLVGQLNYGNAVIVTVKTPSAGDTWIGAVVTAINSAGLTNVTAQHNSDDTITITHATGGDIKFNDANNVLGDIGFTPWDQHNPTNAYSTNFYHLGDYEPDGFQFKASNWAPLITTAAPNAPVTPPSNGTLWYDSITDQADIMYNDGTNWKGYRNAFPATDPNGPIISSTRPTTQSDGKTALADGEIWIDRSDIEMYGLNIYVYNGNTLQWVKQDPTDHTSPNGWVFADARWAVNGYSTAQSSIASLLISNFLDPDAPDPGGYPRGTRLFNLRRSGFNVKRYEANYINIYANNGVNPRYTEPMDGSNSTTAYATARWVTVSPNRPDGAGSFGRHAQRGFVVAALKALIDTNQTIRDTDSLVFNLIAAPGYPEAVQNLIALNTDRGQTAFVIGDTPFRLQANGTDLQAWGLNTNGAFDNGDDGAISYDDYMAFFYPSGFTNDNTGNYIVVPPSHMMLRTFINSDAKSYEWFAPAGIRRGNVDNATSVGYIDDQTGEFQTTALPQSLRDVLATTKVNPIPTLTGSGIVNFGNYTRAPAASSLDRINVARLVAYLRRQLSILVSPYLFEPNDQITRSEVKNAVDSFLLELVGQRAIYDYLVVCDTSNNTPARIDRSELWVDIAIEPVKAVEFIYVPVRLLNTGAIASGNLGDMSKGG